MSLRIVSLMFFLHCFLTNNLKELTIMDRNIASNIVAHNAAAIDTFAAAVTNIVPQPV